VNADRITEVYEGTHASAFLQRRARRRIHWMCRQADGDEVLDVGCSQGIASILLGREGKAVTGIDHEQAAIEFALGRLEREEQPVRDRVAFRLAEARDLPFADDAFDTVLLGEVLEHQVDPRPTLAEAARVVRPTGRVVITAPYGLFPHHDHKEPLYLGGLTDLLADWFVVVELELIDAYLALVAGPKEAGRPPADPRRALDVAEARLAALDDELERARHRPDGEAEERAATLRSELARRAEEVGRLEAALAQERRRVAGAREEREAVAAERDRLRRELSHRHGAGPLASTRIGAQDLTAAATAALRALDREPESDDLRWRAADALSHLELDARFGPVMDALGPVEALPRDRLREAGDLALRAGDYGRALTIATEIERRAEEPLEAARIAAVAHWELGEETRAEALMAPLGAGDAAAGSLRVLAAYRLRVDDPVGARSALERLEPDGELLMECARRFRQHGRLGEARDVVDRLLAHQPGDARAQGYARLIAGEQAVVDGVWARGGAPAPLRPVPGRVLHLLQRTLPHHLAGSTIRSHAVGRAQLAMGLDVHMVTQPGFPWNAGVLDADPVDLIEGVVYHRVADLPGAAPALDERLRRNVDLLADVVEELRPAVLHPASTYVNAAVAIELGRRFGLPVVYEVRGFPEERRFTRRHTRVALDANRSARAIERRCWEDAGHITTLARVMERHMVEQGVDPGKITVVPNAVDGDELRPAPRDEALARRLGIDDGDLVVGYVSTFAVYEGIEHLLRATALLLERGRPVRCLLVGDGGERRYLEQEAGRLGIASRAIFTGWVARDEVAAHYGLLDLFVVPRTNELVSRLVTPLKPYEAMALERPVVAARTEAMEEMVEDGVTGRLFPPEDPAALAGVLEELMDDPAQARRLAEQGRSWVVEHRSWRRNAELYLDVYRRLGAL
jgi:glycosyltransferase involved in cell wall biosynthesis/SAM-dependent methyltransferase